MTPGPRVIRSPAPSIVAARQPPARTTSTWSVTAWPERLVVEPVARDETRERVVEARIRWRKRADVPGVGHGTTRGPRPRAPPRELGAIGCPAARSVGNGRRPARLPWAGGSCSSNLEEAAEPGEVAPAHRDALSRAGPDHGEPLLEPDLVHLIDVHDVLLVAAHERGALLEHLQRQLGEELVLRGHDVHAGLARADELDVRHVHELDG